MVYRYHSPSLSWFLLRGQALSLMEKRFTLTSLSMNREREA